MTSNGELDEEQQYVSMLYARLDELRAQVSTRLARVLGQAPHSPQARVERDAATHHYHARLAQLDAAENGLCFGRLDLRDGERRYIGRIGIREESDDLTPLLIDWRAPAARPFYLATVATPEGVRRRRHIRTRGRTVVDIYDDVLDIEGAPASLSQGTTGDAALLAALNAARTGQMSDIVATIQAEQDKIIRSPHRGVLVVQGAPGTGKTVVALHRAAYLLYTHRERLARRGVLIIGPTAAFLRYIGQVLPSLGETGVVLSTLGELYPSVTATRAEPAEVAEIKGRRVMTGVIAAAVRDRETVPEGGLEIPFEGEMLRVDRRTCRPAVEQARATRLPHNQARSVFVRRLTRTLARQYADRIGANPFRGGNLLGDADIEDIRRELLASEEVRAALDRLWPIFSPQRLLTSLFASAERLARAAPQLSVEERRLLRREPGAGWTVADVPLLDEAAELLGEYEAGGGERAARTRRERIAYAQGVLDIAYGSRSTDFESAEESEILAATDLMDAETLAERYEERDHRTAAERAVADRTWAFGHVVVDEAQELSEMAWRMVMRRCPTRSMTVVGDVAQTGDLAGTTSWRRVFEPHVGDRWRLERLTVNYRMPAEIMAIAAELLAETDPAADPPRSVRRTGTRPWRVEVPTEEGLPGHLARLVVEEAAEMGEGRLAVIVPTAWLGRLAPAVTATLPQVAVGDDPDLASPVVVLSADQVRGLEFDVVIVVEPEQIIAASPRGRNDLYVCLTRATQRLGVVHCRRLPPPLARLPLRAGLAP